MSPQVFAAIATLGAAFSLAANLWAFFKARDRSFQTMYLITVGYSFAYVLLWGWLATHPETDRATWSEVATPFSVTSFFTVWSGFAIMEIIRRKGIEDAAKERSPW